MKYIILLTALPLSAMAWNGQCQKHKYSADDIDTMRGQVQSILAYRQSFYCCGEFERQTNSILNSYICAGVTPKDLMKKANQSIPVESFK